jgi:FkbH-like protein
VTITEALKAIHSVPRDTPRFQLSIVCGFTPVHLQTFLTARLQQKFSDRKVTPQTGLFGNAVGTLESLGAASADVVACVLEWSDLDPRLGFREGSQWGSAAISDAVESGNRMLQRAYTALQQVPAGIRVAVCLPTLPLPPVFHTTSWNAGNVELRLQESIAAFATAISQLNGITVVNSRKLAEQSPAASRYDFKSDITTGLPYTLSHADAVAAALAEVLFPPPPKKGLISDLDNTLWHGIVGEIGAENIQWDLASHHLLHGLYQKLLAAMSEQGVLVGIASKNDSAVVEKAFQRDDILLKAGSVFPMEVHWNAKSGSVERILKQWNISADTVVFVDDSPMELAEVKAAHPGIECIEFPVGDYAAGYAMLRRLRDLFGKQSLSADDAIRVQSIRQGAAFQEAAASASAPESFLEAAQAVITFDYDASPREARLLELVNKTNQFNLNGVRFTESEWHSATAAPQSILASVTYEDKYGTLGKIAVIQGVQNNGTLNLNVWVMSCRAFARRIEHRCLQDLFERFDLQQVRLNFDPTAKNGPTQEFLTSLTGFKPAGEVTITRNQFESVCPPLYHKVRQSPAVVEANG